MHMICWLMMFLLLISLFVFRREMHRDWNVGLNGLFLVTWECCILNAVWFCVFWQLSCLTCLMEQRFQSMLILWWGRTISRMLFRGAINKVTFVSIPSPMSLYSVHLYLDSRCRKGRYPTEINLPFLCMLVGRKKGYIYIFFLWDENSRGLLKPIWAGMQKNLLAFLETAEIEQKRNMHEKRGKWSSGPHHRSHENFFLRLQCGEWTQDSVELARP